MNCLEADGFMRKADFTVSLAGGLHARPAALFSQEAGKFKSRVVMRMKGIRWEERFGDSWNVRDRRKHDIFGDGGDRRADCI